jgi:hypothetical protein
MHARRAIRFRPDVWFLGVGLVEAEQIVREFYRDQGATLSRSSDGKSWLVEWREDPCDEWTDDQLVALATSIEAAKR